MRYEPLANRVIVQPIEEKKVTAGGLFIPDVATRNKGVAFGTVMAVGPGRHNADGQCIPVHVKVGDVVLFPRQAPAVLPLLDNDGSETAVLMLPENDIIAVVHDLPRESHIVDVTGAPLSIEVTSRGDNEMADSVYESRDALERAERMGFVDPSEHVDEVDDGSVVAP